MKKKSIHVVLGRFSPIHLGHQMIIDRIIRKYGVKNCLLIIGSSTSLNSRNPYSFSVRKRMIKSIYPEINMVGIPDTDKGSLIFSNTNMDIWLNRIKSLESKLKAKFIFYGGSSKDLNYLSNTFETKVIIDRNLTGNKISATKVRNALQTKNFRLMKKFVSEKIASLLVKKV